MNRKDRVREMENAATGERVVGGSMSSSHAEPVRHKLRHKAVWNSSSWNAVEGGEGINLVKKEAKGKR